MTKRLSPLLYLSLVCCCWQPLLASEELVPGDEELNALVLYGSAGIATWNQTFNQTLLSELGPELSQQITPEFLSLVGASEVDRQLIAQSLALRYSNHTIDLVVAVLPESNRFVHDYAQVFAPDAAVLHVLPGVELANENLHGDNEALILSAADDALAQTLDLISLLLPDTTQVYVVAGVGDTDRTYTRRVEIAAERSQPDYELIYLSGLPPDELLSTLRASPPNSAILMTTYDLDTEGQEWRTLVISDQLVEQTDLPVFSLASTQPLSGALGGSVTTPNAYAATAADMLNQMLAGDIPEQPVIGAAVNMFNGAQLDRFGINRARLPEGSLIVADPPNLWRQYRAWIITGVVVFFIQLALIALLLQSKRRHAVTEAELRRTQKLEALGSLSGGIAHDFNNILMSIVANAELGLKENADEPKLKQKFTNILTSSDRAKHLVRQILMFNRQATGMEPKSLNLASHIEDSVSQIRAFMPESCVVEIHYADDLASAKIDPTRFHQLLLNLCVNAQHAVEGRGLITIVARNVNVERSRTFFNQTLNPGDYVVISVRDNGSGIKADDMTRVFEPFFSTKPAGQGTGLGLALVYQIIKSHGGYIDLESKPGEGTTVTMYLPAESRGGEELKPLSQLTQGRGSNESILLVDDDEMVLDVTRQAMLNMKYQVKAFSSSVGALKHFRKNPDRYDLVFSDLSMPEMDGVRLISNIRQVRSDIPVVLCTGYMESVGAGEIDNCQYLQKPASSGEIAEALFNALHDPLPEAAP